MTGIRVHVEVDLLTAEVVGHHSPGDHAAVAFDQPVVGLGACADCSRAHGPRRGRVVTSQDVAFGGVYDAQQGHGVVEWDVGLCIRRAGRGWLWSPPVSVPGNPGVDNHR